MPVFSDMCARVDVVAVFYTALQMRSELRLELWRDLR